MREAKCHRAHYLVMICVALVASLLVTGAAALVPVSAAAMTINKATARPNEDGGDGVLGGLETRLTWEATVDDGESVSSLTLKLPEGSSFDSTTTRITVLDGLTRISVDGQAQGDGSELDVSFSEPISSGSLLRLEVEGVVFPEAGGDITVTGDYTTSDGQTEDLQASSPITVEANTPLQKMVTALDESPAVQAWNSIPFCGMFLKPQLLLTGFASLFPGWLICLLIVLIAYPFAIVLGLIFSLLKISRFKVLRAIAAVYINILRGTPLFLQIYIAFFGLPMVGININNNVLGVIVMAINSSAYLAEIFRAGIQSIPIGQYEAADSLGMSHMQTMFSIILPQTIRRVIPTVTSDFITSYKDTSLLSSVGVMELMMYSKNLTAVTGNITPYMAAAIYYLIVTLPLIKIVSIVEKHLAAAEHGGGPRPKDTAKAANAKQVQASSAEEPGQTSAAEQASTWSALMSPFTSHPLAGGAEDVN